MKFKHFFAESEMQQKDYNGLRTLLADCDLVRKKQISEVVDSGNYKSVICVYDDEENMVGFAALVLEYGYINLNVLFVDYDERRKGYGKALLKEVKAFAHKLDLDTVELIALDYSKPALRLYEKNGFIYTTRHNLYTSQMKMYVNSSGYVVGGLLNAISKKYGKSNLAEGLKACRESGDMAIFDGAFKKNVKESTIKSLMESGFVEACAVCLSKLGDNPKSQEFVKKFLVSSTKGNYKKGFCDKILPNASRETAHEFATCLDAYYAFRNQDRLFGCNKIGKTVGD